MPTSLHPQAKFDPVPPDLDLHALVERTPNFEWVVRISAAQIRNLGPHEFDKLVLIHVVKGGRPLVIDKWNDRLPPSLFSAKWLEGAYDKKQENVWDIGSQANIPMTTGHYLRSMKALTNQWTAHNYRDERRQRLYLKDIDCPPEWHDHLRKVLPRTLFYLNENVEDRGSANQDDMFVEERAVAPAGDLMSSLPDEMRAQNLMCYVGHEGTYTPAHREMCASLGQNIMVEASGDENGERAGSSIWFMTETKDREVVREYFLSMLGHDVEIEKHLAQINAWKKATFPVYVLEQKVGDFILVPPLAPHQVWNRGTRTMKVAWNRTTAETLDMALHEALPKARLVCRDEQYKNKAIIYYTLDKYYRALQSMEANSEFGLLGFAARDLLRDSVRMRQMTGDFRLLFELFTEVLVDEMFASREKDVEYVGFDSNITCSYCRANIFNRFLTCRHCIRTLESGDEDTYDICMECYAMGRSCLCISGLSWCEQWSWAGLVDKYDTWRTMVVKNDGFIDLDASPPPIEIARKRTGRKTVAQICQEQLRRRPFKDITKPEEKIYLEPSEPEVDANGVIKKNKRKKKKGDVYRCHVCGHKDYKHKLAFCSTPDCTEAYCFGVLYRGFDLMPQAVLQQEDWKCPKCRGICNCAYCRRHGHTNPYVPKNTLLGHDTRPIADDRSVEVLVDFRLHNLGWLKNVGEEGRSQHTWRMQRLRQLADAEKAKDGDLHGSVVKPALETANTAIPVADMGPPDAGSYGKQGHAPESGVATTGDDEAAMIAQLQQLDDAGGYLMAADRSMEDDTMDDSAYPDPSSMGRERMIGVGYYNQDDGPDKILFDPYQQPSMEALEAEDEQSEFLWKTLRAAKRRARQEEDDDPDFSTSRTHQRKKPKPDRESDGRDIDVDPALLDTFMQDATQVEGAGSANLGTEQRQESPPSDSGESHQHGYEANVPALRHVKPMKSYREPEIEDDGSESSESLPAQEPGAPAAQRDANPLDLAAGAVRPFTSVQQQHAQPGTASTPQVPRKRGRPRKSDAEPTTRTSSQAAKAVVVTPRSDPPKKRGRPSRTSQLADAGLGRDSATAAASTPVPAPAPAPVKAAAPAPAPAPAKTAAAKTAAAKAEAAAAKAAAAKDATAKAAAAKDAAAKDAAAKAATAKAEAAAAKAAAAKDAAAKAATAKAEVAAAKAAAAKAAAPTKAVAFAAAASSEDDDSTDSIIAELEAQLDAELAAEEQSDKPREKTPPRALTPPKPAKRRGRPPGRGRLSRGGAPERAADPKPALIADRMAVRGRRLGVGLRSSSGPAREAEAASPVPKKEASSGIRRRSETADSESEEDDSEPQQPDNPPGGGRAGPALRPAAARAGGPQSRSSGWTNFSSSAASAASAASVAGPRGPTVVRLGDDSGSEHAPSSYGKTADSVSGDDDNDDSDEDVPARPPAPSARGRGGRGTRTGL